MGINFVYFWKQIEIFDQMMKLKVYRRGKKKYEEQKKKLEPNLKKKLDWMMKLKTNKKFTKGLKTRFTYI
jgi:hypothetical protein